MSVLRSALRSLARSKRLSLAAVACVALGAAATAAVSTLVGATLLRPVPFPHPDRLVRLWFAEADGNPRGSLSIPDLRDAASALASLEAFVGTARVRIVAHLDGGAERLRGEAVSPGYFDLLGLRPAYGRLLAAEDHAAGAAPAVVLSHRTFVRHFAGDPAAIGRTLRSERAAYTIVGVAPRGFAGTVEDDVVEFYIPLSQYEPASLREDRGSRFAWALGRLRPGASRSAAAGEAAALGRSLRERHPDLYRRLEPRIEAMGENWRSSLRGSGAVLFAASALLLLVAAVNVAGLLLARVFARRRELAVRAALGAGRRRLAVQLLLEAFLLVAAGSALGVLGAPYVLEGFLQMSPVPLPTYVEVTPDVQALFLAVGAFLVTGVLAGCPPALLGSRVPPLEALNESGRGTVGGTRERRVGAWLVAAEVAVTVVLLVTGGLLLRSWERLARAELGFRTQGVVRLAVTFSQQDVPTPAAIPAFRESLKTALSSHPGVDKVGLVWPTLPPWDGYKRRVVFAGEDSARAEDGIEVGAHLEDGSLLPMLGVPLVAGRLLEPADETRDAAVAVISRALANRMGGPAEALGREITLVPTSDPRDPAGAHRIVGVAENVAFDGVSHSDTRRYIRWGDAGDAYASGDDVYLPLPPIRTVSIGAFTRGDAAAMLEALRRRLAQAAPTSAIHWTSTMDDELAGEFAPSRFYALLVTAFSTSALLLTGVGLFAVVSHGASRRTAEIGLRVALGARPGQIRGLVLRGAGAPLALGLAAGLLAAVVATRWLGGLLYGIPALDGPTFAGAAGALLAIAFPAGWLPARRASALDPMRALRDE